jgi:hypothetical protein
VRRKHRDATTDHFDLLPFIAILLCVLGCLLMVTISVSAISIGPSLGEGWIPVQDKNAVRKTPVLIEWDGHTAVIHRGRAKTMAHWTEAGSDTALSVLIEDLAARKDSLYALFAVRPSGFGSFSNFADMFRDRRIDVGYEAIKQDKPVRLLLGK